jgi:hypothetical protein
LASSKARDNGVGRVASLGYDALKPELAGVVEDQRAFLDGVLVGPQARRNPTEQPGQGCLPIFKLLAPQILAVQLNEVESP